MPINFKAAAMLAFGVATLLSAGQASAETCDGSVQTSVHGRTVQCYYLPTVSNGRVTGLQKVSNYGDTRFANPYSHPDHPYSHPGAVIGNGNGAWGHHGGR
jgi:hypothetical protein